MRLLFTAVCLLPATLILASCASQQSQHAVPSSRSAAAVSTATGGHEQKARAAEGSAKKTDQAASGKELREGREAKEGKDAKGLASPEMPQTGALSVQDIQSMAENQVLCSRYIGPSALEDAMRKASLIPVKGATAKKPGGTATYRVSKPFRFLGLPVASVSFTGNGDPKTAAFWMTLDAPMKTAVAAVTARNISLKKDVRLGYVLASEPKRGQRVELHSLPKQTMVLCARATA